MLRKNQRIFKFLNKIDNANEKLADFIFSNKKVKNDNEKLADFYNFK